MNTLSPKNDPPTFYLDHEKWSPRAQRRLAGAALFCGAAAVAAWCAFAWGVWPTSGASYLEKKEALAEIHVVRQAAELWRALDSAAEECPSLSVLVRDKRLDDHHEWRDPWGTPYEITCIGNHVHVLSLGPDRRAGTTDDIVDPDRTTTAPPGTTVRDQPR